MTCCEATKLSNSGELSWSRVHISTGNTALQFPICSHFSASYNIRGDTKGTYIDALGTVQNMRRVILKLGYEQKQFNCFESEKCRINEQKHRIFENKFKSRESTKSRWDLIWAFY